MANVRLFNAPWSKEGGDFPALTPSNLRTSLITNNFNIGGEYTNISYIKDGIFELPVNLSAVEKTVNYCIFSNINDQYWCAFINRMEWTSANSTRFYYEIDWFSTFATSASIHGWRVRRKLSATDTPTIIRKGDFIGNGWYTRDKRDIAIYPDNEGKTYFYAYIFGDTLEQIFDTTTFNKQAYSKLHTNLLIILLGNDSDKTAFVNWVNDNNTFNNVAAIYELPYLFPSQTTGTLYGHTFYIYDEYTDPLQATTTLAGAGYNIFNNDNDLRICININGAENIIPYSDLNSLLFTIKYGLYPKPYVVITPDYASANNAKSYTFDSFSEIALTKDVFQEWQNRNVYNLIAGGTGIALSALTGNYGVAGAQLINTALSTLQGSFNARTQTPPTTAQSANALQSAGLPFVSIYTQSWRDGNVEGLQFYNRNGYPTREFGAIGINSGNETFDIIQAVDITVKNVPAQAQTEITKILNRGVRVWNTANIS